MLADQLDSLTEQFPDCLIAAYADIGTGVTLVSSNRLNAPREALDELCAEAAISLGMPDAPAIGAVTSPIVVKSADQAVFVYLRSADEPNDALLCMCRPKIALDAFLTAARACLKEER